MRGQCCLLDRVPQWGDRHVRGQHDMLHRLQQLLGDVLDRHLSRQRGARGHMHVESRLCHGLWLQRHDGRHGLLAEPIEIRLDTSFGSCDLGRPGGYGMTPFTRENVLAMLVREYDIDEKDITLEDRGPDCMAVSGDVEKLAGAWDATVYANREASEKGWLGLIDEFIMQHDLDDNFRDDDIKSTLDAFKAHSRLEDLEVYFAYSIRKSNRLFDIPDDDFWKEFIGHGLLANEDEMKHTASFTRVKQLQDKLIEECRELPVEQLLQFRARYRDELRTCNPRDETRFYVRMEEPIKDWGEENGQSETSQIIDILRIWCHFDEAKVCRYILDKRGGIENWLDPDQIWQTEPEGFIVEEHG